MIFDIVIRVRHRRTFYFHNPPTRQRKTAANHCRPAAAAARESERVRARELSVRPVLILCQVSDLDQGFTRLNVKVRLHCAQLTLTVGLEQFTSKYCEFFFFGNI